MSGRELIEIISILFVFLSKFLCLHFPESSMQASQNQKGRKMFFKTIGAIGLIMSSGQTMPVQAYDLHQSWDLSDSAFTQMWRSPNQTSTLGNEAEYSFSQNVIQNALVDGHIDETQMLSGGPNAQAPLLARPLTVDGNVFGATTASDTITLLVRGGPVWSDDATSMPGSVVWDTYKMFAPISTNVNKVIDYHTLFDSSMSAAIGKTDVYMVNEEQFFEKRIEFYANFSSKADNGETMRQALRINYANAHHIKKAIQALHQAYPTKKINIVNWSYGSFIGNMALAMWPHLLDEVNKWVTIGTVFNQHEHVATQIIEANYIILPQGVINIAKSSWQNLVFSNMVNASLIDNYGFLQTIGKEDHTDYISYIKQTQKVTYLQNTFDSNVGALSASEITDMETLGTVKLDYNNWEIDNVAGTDPKLIYDNYVNHYSFKNFNQQGLELLDTLDYE